MAIYSVVVAAGVGKRFGTSLPKQYTEIHGQSVLQHSIRALSQVSRLNDCHLVVAADDDFAKEVEELIAQRTKARSEKDWATADAIRDKLKEMKVVVKDTKDGIEWHVEG